jgi:2-C-methyl-D-erythritol 4-phosphate cytidylyltransferase
MKATVIVAAAGRGQRMKEKVNKQYLPLAGKPVLYYSLAACLASGRFEQIVVVVTPGEEELLRRDVLLPYFPDTNICVVGGGKERQDSVWEGLLAVNADSDLICVHDGARPLVTPELLNRSLETATRLGTAVAAVPVKDTIKQVDESRKVVETPPRHSLWAVQTPQTFRRDWLEDAYKRARHDSFYATDDAALLEHYGYPVHIFPSEYSNLKVTTPDDLVLAEALLGRETHAHWDRV